MKLQSEYLESKQKWECPQLSLLFFTETQDGDNQFFEDNNGHFVS